MDSTMIYLITCGSGYALILIAMMCYYAKGLQSALQDYASPNGKSMNELTDEIPVKQRDVSYLKCLLAVTIILFVIWYSYKGLITYLDGSILTYFPVFSGLVILGVASLICIYTDFKYAVISNRVTYPTMVFGILMNLIMAIQFKDSDYMMIPLLQLSLFSICFVCLGIFFAFTKHYIGGGDLKLFLAVILCLPVSYLSYVIILIGILALANYGARGIISFIRTKKWTSDRTMRLGIWMGVSIIIYSAIYIVSMFS